MLFVDSHSNSRAAVESELAGKKVRLASIFRDRSHIKASYMQCSLNSRQGPTVHDIERLFHYSIFKWLAQASSDMLARTKCASVQALRRAIALAVKPVDLTATQAVLAE